MFTRFLTLIGLIASSSTAFAAADLAVTMTGPSATPVYATARYNVRVANIGNQSAYSSSVVVQLPLTTTSPVKVMGTLGARSSQCAVSGFTLTCALGTIGKNKSVTVYFDFALPESTRILSFGANATTTSTETVTGNNSTSHTPLLLNSAVALAAPQALLNSHCTGTNLSSYFECTLFPSSISSHATTLNADYSISFPPEAGPSYTGVWSQDSADHLAFSYFEDGFLVAEFDGYGVNSTCWEGPTLFPGSSYMSMYRVCIQ